MDYDQQLGISIGREYCIAAQNLPALSRLAGTRARTELGKFLETLRASTLDLGAICEEGEPQDGAPHQCRDHRKRLPPRSPLSRTTEIPKDCFAPGVRVASSCGEWMMLESTLLDSFRCGADKEDEGTVCQRPA